MAEFDMNKKNSEIQPNNEYDFQKNNTDFDSVQTHCSDDKFDMDSNEYDSSKQGMAIASLVFGILSFVILFFFVGVFAGILGLIFGIIVLRARESGIATAGVVLSIVGIFINLIVDIFIIMFFKELVSHGGF